MLIFAAVLAIFIYGMIAAMLGTILPDLSDRFHLSPSQNGTIAFAQALGLIIASLGVGPLLDNEGKKIGLILGLTFISIALFALPRSTGFRSILFLIFLLGVGGGIVVTAANALVSDVGQAHRATALNLVNLFFGLGGLTTPFISANLFGRNWVRLCYTIASLTVVTLVDPGPHQNACAHGRGRFRARRCGSGPRPPAAASNRTIPLSVHRLRGGRLELVAPPPHRAGHPRVARSQHSFSGIRTRPADRPRSASRAILIRVPAVTVTLVASVAMAFTTFLMLRTIRPAAAFVLVFLSGLSMAPVFPTTLAIVADAFPRMTGTAMGFVITCGWIGLAVSSRIIGVIAGGDPRRLQKALLVIPASAVLMVGLDLAIQSALR